MTCLFFLFFSKFESSHFISFHNLHLHIFISFISILSFVVNSPSGTLFGTFFRIRGQHIMGPILQQSKVPQQWILTLRKRGEQHGLTFSVEACYSEGQGFESPRRLSLLKNVLRQGREKCIVRSRKKKKKEEEEDRTCKTRSGIESV